MKVVGAYVRALRDDCGMTQIDLAVAAKLSEKTIRNLESGRHDPKIEKLAEIVQIVKGSILHLAQLMHPDATLDVAKRLVNEVRSGTGFTDDQRMVLENLSPEQKDAVMRVAQQMTRSS